LSKVYGVRSEKGGTEKRVGPNTTVWAGVVLRGAGDRFLPPSWVGPNRKGESPQ